MLHTRRLLIPLLFAPLAFLSGCGCNQAEEMTARPSPVATTVGLTPSPLPSPAPPAAATRRPSSTPTPTRAAPTATIVPTVSVPTSTPSPTATASPSPTPHIAVQEFTAQPDLIAPGEPITLTWSVVAEWANIRVLDERGSLVEPPLTSELAGTLRVDPNPELWNQVQFTLYAGVGDRFERRDLAVAVKCVEEWAFAGPPPGCPTPARVTTFVAQQFQAGLMLWLEPTEEHGPAGDIIILYTGDDTPIGWEVVPDGFQEGMPESDPELVPPGNLIQPVRGFGKVWRELPHIRERLGWALEEEYVMGTGVLQCSHGKYSTCYVSGPHSDVYLLHPWGTSWELWRGIESAP